MKRYIKLFMMGIILMVLFISGNVHAKEIYYTNDNGVSLSEEEYDFFSRVYWEGYQEYLTPEKYEMYVANDFLNAEVASSTTQDINANSPQGTFHSTTYKGITITKVCSNTCIIATVTDWYLDPSVRSYDVIGSYIYGATRIGTPSTLISSTTSSFSSNLIKYDTNGFGTSFQLPGGSSLKITQDFVTTTSGHIYASYQHAMQTSSLSISQSYNISLTGFGGVFGFYGSAYSIYDDMNGVDIVL